MKRNIFILALVLTLSPYIASAQSMTTDLPREELIRLITILSNENPALKSKLESKVLVSDLAIGSSGDEVRTLQTILALDKSVYPEGKVTGYFGPLTARAVIRYQTKYGLENKGYVRKETRDHINALINPKTQTSQDMSVTVQFAKTITHVSVERAGEKSGFYTNETNKDEIVKMISSKYNVPVATIQSIITYIK